MKSQKTHSPPGIGRALLGILALFVFATFASPQAHADISGNATVHNKVTVQYSSGDTIVTAYAAVNVTVATVAAAPTITVPGDDTTTNGTALSYDIEIRSNANGLDTYNLTQATAVDGVQAATYTYNPESTIDLWGGITIAAPSGGGTNNTLYFPGGALTDSGLAENSSIIYYNGNYYTVTGITEGSKTSTDTDTGVTTDEEIGSLALSPIDPAPNITSWNPGDPVGEVKTIRYSFTAGAPTTAGDDGTYTYSIIAESEATDLNGDNVSTPSPATDSQKIVITVQSPSLSITKTYRVVASGTDVPGTVTPADYGSTGSAKPGQVIEYLITIENTNTNSDSVASSVTIKDPLPPYTDYVIGSTYVGNGTTTLTQVADVSAASALSQTDGYTLSDPVAGNSTAYIVFQVEVQ